MSILDRPSSAYLAAVVVVVVVVVVVAVVVDNFTTCLPLFDFLFFFVRICHIIM